MADIIDLKTSISKAQDDYSRACDIIDRSISGIGIQLCEDVLRKKYLEGMEWVGISQDTGKCIGYLQSRHRQGLRLIKIDDKPFLEMEMRKSV